MEDGANTGTEPLRSEDLSRRDLLRGLVTGTAAAASLARLARADAGEDAAYWAKVRAEFMVTDEVAYMNNGTLGPCPKPVFYTVVERYRALAADPGGQNKPQEDAAEEVRRDDAAFVGAQADEIALTRNTTEGNTVRASTHYYNTEAQVERLCEGLRDIIKRGVIPAPTKAA